MKGESIRRPVTLLLCLLVIVVVSLGAGTAVSVGAPLSPSDIFGPAIPVDPDIWQQLQQNLDLTTETPVVTDVNPNGGLTTGGDEVVITGTEFTGASAVTFGGTAATFTVDSDTQITATAPARAAGTVQVQVTTAGGASPDTSADDYTYVAPPATTATPTTATPTTAAPTPTTSTPTTAAPTATTAMVTTTVVVADEGDGGISGGWIAFIVVIALIALIALGAMVYMLGKGGKKGGPAA
jgi:hypothetical protein